VKAIGECLGSCQVLDPEENVTESGEADVIGRKFPSEPLMSIEIDLDLHGEPALNPYVNQAEVAIHGVVVKMQALAAGRLNEGAPCAEAEGESATGLEDGKNTPVLADELFQW